MKQNRMYTQGRHKRARPRSAGGQHKYPRQAYKLCHSKRNDVRQVQNKNNFLTWVLGEKCATATKHRRTFSVAWIPAKKTHKSNRVQANVFSASNSSGNAVHQELDTGTQLCLTWIAGIHTQLGDTQTGGTRTRAYPDRCDICEAWIVQATHSTTSAAHKLHRS